ncbi:MBL fold metallo-hydrolase [Nocardioides sp. YR527]|uniref:MBL fold metallo-hydrolase n=1 Tax=Nocardioides sp. YR527 TaxID=1881028 RepID=UPI001C40AE7D|nr:MBL fold metallo-hydrolase [Nocardioides sp. YR527]
MSTNESVPHELPTWVHWEQRPFPDANLLLLDGREPALMDSGFVGHADRTAAWVERHTGRLHRVVNTHWHSDHVGGNSLLQQRGVGIAASTPDSDALKRRDPGCCAAEYLDQPVPPYDVDEALGDGDILTLGNADWEVITTPGHTPGHLAFWQPDERLLVVGDALSDYDVGWVSLAADGPDAGKAAVASLVRLADLRPRVLLTAHGPLPADTPAAFDHALRRAQRLVDDPDGAVWYGARRIFAFALMIRSGITTDEVEPYLHRQPWLVDAARLLHRTTEDISHELLDSMLRSGAAVAVDGRILAAAPHEHVDQHTLDVPFPRAWPPPGTAATG